MLSSPFTFMNMYTISEKVFAQLFRSNMLLPNMRVRFTDAMLTGIYSAPPVPLDPDIMRLDPDTFIDAVMALAFNVQERADPAFIASLRKMPEFTVARIDSDICSTGPDLDRSMHASIQAYLSGRSYNPRFGPKADDGLYYPDPTDEFATGLTRDEMEQRAQLWASCFYLPAIAASYFKARRDLAQECAYWQDEDGHKRYLLKVQSAIEADSVGRWRPREPIDLFKQVTSMLPTDNSVDFERLTGLLKSDYYFWLSKAIQIAHARKDSLADYGFVLNDVLMKYGDHIRVVGKPLIDAITASVKALFDLISGAYNLFVSPKRFLAESLHDRGVELQSGAFDQAKDFLTQAQNLLKYIHEKGAMRDFTKVIAVGVLGAYAYVSANSEHFNLANLETLVNYATANVDKPTLSSLVRVMTSMYETIRGYQSAPQGVTFGEYIRNCITHDTQLDIGKRLLVQYENWSILDVSAQTIWKEETVAFLAFVDLVFGAKKAWATGKALLRGPRRPILERFQQIYTRLDIGFNAISRGGVRPSPWAMVLAGGSSIGKTFLLELLGSLLLVDALNVPHERRAESTYTWNGQSEFFDGYSNGKRLMILDDVANKLPKLYESTGGDPQLASAINIINNVPFAPPMADLVDKGKVFVDPDAVLVTTNDTTLGLHANYAFPTVMERRFKNWARVRVRDEFATTNGTLDERKLSEWATANPSSVPNVWNFQVEVRVACNDSSGNKEKIRTQVASVHDFDTPQFFKWVSDAFQEHRASQMRFMTAANTKYDWSFLKPAGPMEMESGDLEEERVHSTFTARFRLEASRPINQIAFLVGFAAFPLAYVAPMVWPNIVGLYRQASDWLARCRDYFTVFRDLAEYSVRIRTGLVTAAMRVTAWVDSCLAALGEIGVFVAAFVASFVVSNLIVRSLVPKPQAHPQFESDERVGVSAGPMVDITPLPADFRPRYAPPDAARGARISLTQQSMSLSGVHLLQLVQRNMVQIEFSPERTLGSPQKYAPGWGLFLRDKWLVTNAHYLPHFRQNDPDWCGDWHLTVKRASPVKAGEYVDVVVAGRDVMERVKFLSGRDLVAIYIPDARVFRDITNFLPHRPGVLSSDAYPGGSSIALVRQAEVTTTGHIQELYCGNDPDANLHRWSPTYDIRASLVKASYVKALVHIRTEKGDCGQPYVNYEGWNARYILGLHMGAQGFNKIIAPLYYEDKMRLNPGATTFDPWDEGPEPEQIVVGDANCGISTFVQLESAIARFAFEPGFNGLVTPTGDFYRIHHEPELKPGVWGLKNEEYIFQQTGLNVNPDSYVELGCRKSVTFGKLKSEYHPSPLQPIYRAISPVGMPGPIDTDKVAPALTRAGRNVAAALATGVMMAHNSYDPQLAADFDEAADAVIADYTMYPEMLSQLKVYDELTAINGRRVSSAIGGLVGMHDLTYLTGCEPMKMSTSAGWPFVEAGASPGKKPWFDRDSDGLYHPGPVLRASIDELADKLGDRRCGVKFIFRMVPKDEPLSAAKMETNNVRMIMVGPLDASILIRKYLMSVCRLMALYPFTYACMVGVDATSVQWSQIADFIAGPGMVSFDGDYSKFDKKMIEEVISAAIKVLATMLIRSGNYSDADLFIANRLLGAVTSPVVDVFGVLYWFRAMNASGHNLTTQFNVVVNKLFITYSFLKHMKGVLGKAYDFEFATRLMRAVIRLALYGDDNVVGCLYDDVFNCQVMQNGLRGIIEYTDARKSAVVAPFTARRDLMFLGRYFITRDDGRVVPPLEWKRITKMVMFYRQLPGVGFPELVSPVYRSALMEAYFHGREVFEVFFKHLVYALGTHFDILDETEVVGLFLSHDGEPFNYDFFDAWYDAKADLGWIDDPGFTAAIAAVDAPAAYAEFIRRKQFA